MCKGTTALAYMRLQDTIVDSGRQVCGSHAGHAETQQSNTKKAAAGADAVAALDAPDSKLQLAGDCRDPRLPAAAAEAPSVEVCTYFPLPLCACCAMLHCINRSLTYATDSTPITVRTWQQDSRAHMEKKVHEVQGFMARSIGRFLSVFAVDGKRLYTGTHANMDEAAEACSRACCPAPRALLYTNLRHPSCSALLHGDGLAAVHAQAGLQAAAAFGAQHHPQQRREAVTR